MSLPDTIFIFALALVIFGPKKLPEIGRQIGKLVFEFRRASNEFKLQIEEELRAAEVADRKAQAAAQVSAPPAAAITATTMADSQTTATTADSPESLTIRPPATGAMVSANPPTAGIAAPESEPAATEPSASPAGVSEDLNEYRSEDLSERSDQNQPAGEPIPNHHG